MSELSLRDIVSIGGKPGLHKIVGQRPTGLIVETLDGSGKRFPSSLTQKVSILADISMYTYDEDVPLRDVLLSLHEKAKDGLELVSKSNSGDEVREFFRKVLPDFDEDQVYTSDILKLVSWYRILNDNTDIESVLSEEQEDSKEETSAE